MKSVAIHGVLALFGLGFAYQTWTRPPEEDQKVKDQPVLLDCEQSAFSSLEIETPTHVVTFEPNRAVKEPEYWITARRKPPEPPKDEKTKDEEKKDEGSEAAQAKAGAAAGDSKAEASAKSEPAKDKDEKTAANEPERAAEKPEQPEKKVARPFDPEAPLTFLANKKFHELLDAMIPLRALQALGQIPKDKDEAFGFDKVGTYLRMECGGQKIALDIGGRTYGVGNRYAREPQGKETYLLDGRTLMDLQAAQYRFMQTEFHDFTLADVDEAVVRALGKERKLLHRNRKVPEEARWVDAAEPDRRNELFGNWFQRLRRLKAKAYLAEGQEPGADLAIEAQGMQPVFTIEYRLEGKPKDKLEVVRVDTEQGGFYYARSGTTRRWVTTYDSLARQIEDDIPLLVGAEEAPEPAQTSSAAAEGAASPALDPHADPHGDPHAPFQHP